jgi:hypothetical protein
MSGIRELKTQARNSAENHGHRLGKFLTITRNETGETIVADATCADCGAYVRVNAKPAPNQIDIGGTVYSKQCINRDAYVPRANEILNCGEWSSAEIGAALAETLTKLGHVNVHVYRVELESAIETDNSDYAREVLQCMIADIREMSPPGLEFGMNIFKMHNDGIYLGWFALI